MLLSEIAATSQRVRESASRRAKIESLAACLAQLAPDELPIGVALLAGEPRQGRIGVGYAALRDLRAEPASQPSLALIELDAGLERIAGLRGAGAGGERLRLLAALFTRCTGVEQDFVRRLLLGELRQGALEGLMLDGLARAFGVSQAAVRRAHMLSGDLGVVARAAREGGEAGLAAFRLQVGRPLSPMLAKTAADPAEAIAKLGQAALEWKLDGARVQVHKLGGDVRVWTRQLHEVTPAVPELVELAQGLPVREAVLDGEVIALRADGRPLPFQTTMRRFGRRSDVSRLRAELPLAPFFFDLLHADGEDLIDRPEDERAQALAEVVPPAVHIPRARARQAEQAEAFLQAALGAGHEGIVAKALDGRYEAGRRGASWLKIKRAHTLDLVVLAAEWGSGRRTGYLSNLHLGAPDARGALVMLGKTFKGMTDEMLAFQTQKLLSLEVARDANTVYVRPELLVEVAFDGVQRSPHYPGGLALRFARIKGYREDKRPAEADTLETIRAMAQLEG